MKEGVRETKIAIKGKPEEIAALMEKFKGSKKTDKKPIKMGQPDQPIRLDPK